MRWLIPVLALLLMISVSSAIGLYLNAHLKKSLYSRAVMRVESMSHLLLFSLEAFSNDFYSPDNVRKIQRVVRNIGAVQGVKHVYIVKPDLTILAQSGSWPLIEKLPADIASEINKGFSFLQTTHTIRRTDGKSELIVISDLRGGAYDPRNKSSSLATCVTVYDLSSEDRYVAAEARRLTFWLNVFGLAVVGILYILISRKLVHPLNKIGDVVKNIAHDNFESRAQVLAQDEIGAVAKALNAMLDRLKEVTVSKEELERVHRHLVEAQANMVQSSKMSALGEMASGIAHEINNPLAIIQARANVLKELAEENKASPELVIHAADSIEKTVMRISNIIKGLRSFARDGNNDPFEPNSLASLISDTLELCKERFKNQGVDLQVGPVPTELQINCRPSQISQVLLNILNNAYDAVSNAPEKWVRIEVREVESWIEIHVSDSGPGIPQEYIDKILQPFFTTKPVGKGTGLGLSISRGILSSHGGAIAVNTHDCHTTFIIQLPARRLDALESHPSRSVALVPKSPDESPRELSDSVRDSRRLLPNFIKTQTRPKDPFRWVLSKNSR